LRAPPRPSFRCRARDDASRPVRKRLGGGRRGSTGPPVSWRFRPSRARAGPRNGAQRKGFALCTFLFHVGKAGCPAIRLEPATFFRPRRCSPGACSCSAPRRAGTTMVPPETLAFGPCGCVLGAAPCRRYFGSSLKVLSSPAGSRGVQCQAPPTSLPLFGPARAGAAGFMFPFGGLSTATSNLTVLAVRSRFAASTPTGQCPRFHRVAVTVLPMLLLLSLLGGNITLGRAQPFARPLGHEGRPREHSARSAARKEVFFLPAGPLEPPRRPRYFFALWRGLRRVGSGTRPLM